MKKFTDPISGGHYWQDSNGNRWSTLEHTEEEAAALSQTLTNCSDCLECSHCSNCIRCIKCDYCDFCTDCIGCGYCYRCRKCSTIGYCLECKRCLCCSHCTACDYCVNISHCSCVHNKVNAELVANIKDGGDLERASMLCCLALDIKAIVGKFGSSTIESGGRLWFTVGDYGVRMEYPSDKGEELVVVRRLDYDPIHPKELGEDDCSFVLRRMPREAKKFLRLWQKVVEEADKNKEGKKND